jgi:hypothetical protein
LAEVVVIADGADDASAERDVQATLGGRKAPAVEMLVVIIDNIGYFGEAVNLPQCCRAC